MPLHLKASDQSGLQGKPIFDPVGTNEYIKRALSDIGWRSNVTIPNDFDFLGTDVDFARGSLLVEAQFSNYPFLLNNVIRSELFSKAGLSLDGSPVDSVIIITKGHMFPASNSTLYYEQAVKQLNELAHHSVFDVPMRLVGLKEDIDQTVNARWTDYSATRYSRTVVTQRNCICRIQSMRNPRSRCNLTVTFQ